MKFKIDENLPVEFADELRALGHDAKRFWSKEWAGLQMRTYSLFVSMKNGY